VIIVETVLSRWYAVAFVIGFFVAASTERGWRRALRFWLIASGVAFAFEYTSTHSGFPYGRYDYTGFTRGDELYVSNIPLFVPLSHAVLIWAGRAIAITGFRARSRNLIPFLGALGAVLVDLVVDPVSLHGNEWFLGDLYRWGSAKGYLGVPLTNFLGWYLAALIVLWVDEALDVGRERTFDALRGVTLALSVMAFNVLIAVGIGQWRVALSGVVITTAVTWMCLPTLRELAKEQPAPGSGPV
jgi:putative membrane protein